MKSQIENSQVDKLASTMQNMVEMHILTMQVTSLFLLYMFLLQQQISAKALTIFTMAIKIKTEKKSALKLTSSIYTIVP